MYVYLGACQTKYAANEAPKTRLPLLSPVGVGMTTASGANFAGETNFTHSYAGFDGGEKEAGWEPSSQRVRVGERCSVEQL